MIRVELVRLFTIIHLNPLDLLRLVGLLLLPEKQLTLAYGTSIRQPVASLLYPNKVRYLGERERFRMVNLIVDFAMMFSFHWLGLLINTL